jgi:hypothetical protein
LSLGSPVWDTFMNLLDGGDVSEYEAEERVAGTFLALAFHFLVSLCVCVNKGDGNVHSYVNEDRVSVVHYLLGRCPEGDS